MSPSRCRARCSNRTGSVLAGRTSMRPVMRRCMTRVRSSSSGMDRYFPLRSGASNVRPTTIARKTSGSMSPTTPGKSRNVTPVICLPVISFDRIRRTVSTSGSSGILCSVTIGGQNPRKGGWIERNRTSMSEQDCLFCKIVAGDIAADKDADAPLLGQLFQAANAAANLSGLEQRGYRIATNVGEEAGQTVFHLHLHIMGGAPLGPLAVPEPQERAP